MVLFENIDSEWVSEWLLFRAKSAMFQLYHGENKLHSLRWGPFCIRPPGLSLILIVLAHRNNSNQVDMSPHWTHYHDSEPTSHSYISLMLHDYRRRSKFQFHGLWFDLTGTRTPRATHSSEHTDYYTTDVADNIDIITLIML